MNGGAMMKFGMGASVLRLEDTRFLTGKGRYVSDFIEDDALRAFALRAQIAHGRFTLSGLDMARSMPGVRLILTAQECTGLGPMPHRNRVRDADGNKIVDHPRPVVADGIVRHVGEILAFVVAETLDQARDAAEAIGVDYETLPVAASIASAIDPETVEIWPDRPGNIAFVHRHGDKGACDAAFAKAARTVSLTLVNNRLVANYMEPRGVVAKPDPERAGATLAYVPSQNAVDMRHIIGVEVLGLDLEAVNVVTSDVGGGFGTKLFAYAETPLTVMASRQLDAPVAWVQERGEHFLHDAQGRDNLSSAQMALDEDGHFLALRLRIYANVGAYLSQFASFIPWVGPSMATGLYAIPALDCEVRAIYTNTAPVDAYRGAGRPEAAYLIERFVDYIAAEIGMDRFDLRSRNFIRPDQLPYRTQTGRIYDTGDFDAHMRAVLARADHDGFAARRAESASRGKLRGFGLSSYVEACAFPSVEGVETNLLADGTVELLIGTQSNGQGHETAYAQIAAAHLGLEVAAVKVIQGDTRRIKAGGGTGGSRSIPIGAVASDRAALLLSEQIRKKAGDLLEASVEDVELEAGTARIVGTDRRVTLAEIHAAMSPDERSAKAEFKPDDATYPNGSHAVELEIDPDTGAVTLLAHTIVDDFGVTLNPILLEGQIHGGIAQGLGQALMEEAVYDADGQLLTASFLDYAMPRAADLPFYDFETRNVPSKHNPLGLKGAGEAGTVGATPAVMNALVDALAVRGVRHFDMPARPEKLWRLASGL